ncbi:Chloroperoxidase [Tricladium varicosporioides]|nr:Chloroperoxidase [Hymenoscyphus varicosporioides]
MSTEEKSISPPEGHPPIDWSKWTPAGEGDVRSPCPMINALSNHSILPHSGKGITKGLVVTTLTQALNLSPQIANVFASVAVSSNPDHSAHTFDLDHVRKHGLIEHDVSLSRADIASGDNYTFDKERWDEVLRTYLDEGEWQHEDGPEDEKKGQEGKGKRVTNFHAVSKARYERVMKCKKEHEDAGKEFGYGIKEFILSYGESALFLGLLGDPKEGKIPVEYLRVLFEQERIPFNEGWRPSETPVTQGDMNHMIFSLIMANEHKADEAKAVGLGTVHAVSAAVTSILPTYCTIM